ncbi:unnamed protein product [Owenia fusiformis]|uniref:Uncharacterized protein n=1 Tax=Owenia fusiformis TaxID=6347 RepID=A0A8J1XFK6_OWEFU|nr:unnamed protein product [Owenia fusiformis]
MAFTLDSRCPAKLFILILLWLTNVVIVKCQNEFNLTFIPKEIERLVEEQERIITVEYPCWTSGHALTFKVDNEVIARVMKNATVFLGSDQLGEKCEEYRRLNASITIRGVRLGRTTLTAYHQLINRTTSPGVAVHRNYRISVVRRTRTLDTVYRAILIPIVIILTLCMGCALDLDVIKVILKRPIPPFIGFCCQFILMPLLGFAISQAFRMEAGLGLGLLVVSCSPGGGASNAWSVLLRGDINLSMTMTFISKICALFMMPLWLFTLGRFYLEQRIGIPYVDIVLSLISLLTPIIIGVIIRKIKASIADFLTKGVRVMSLSLIVYILGFGTYVNVYRYRMMGSDPSIIPSAFLLPAFGFTMGMGLARLLRQTPRNSVTIGIETGIQDITISLVVLQFTFGQPEADLAAVMPIATVLFMHIPLMIAYVILTIYARTCEKNKKEKDGELGAIGTDNITEKEDIPQSTESVIDTKPGVYSLTWKPTEAGPISNGTANGVAN